MVMWCVTVWATGRSIGVAHNREEKPPLYSAGGPFLSANPVDLEFSGEIYQQVEVLDKVMLDICHNESSISQSG